MTSEKIEQFKKFFSEYCNEEISAGRCEEDSCAFCAVNTAYEEIFKNADEDVQEKLYKAMFYEQTDFETKLRSMTPEDILRHAHEYVIREDILTLAQDGFDENVCRALLQLATPLAYCYKIVNDSTQGNDLGDSIMCAINRHFASMIEADLDDTENE
jgi:hypothetical protein